MKHTATMDDANHSFNDTVSVLRKHFTQINRQEPEQVKLANEYYKWTTLKTNLILEEKLFQIPPSALPNTIKRANYEWLHPEKQSIISRHYHYDKETDKYIICTRKENVPQEDIEIIVQALVLVRKAVVWVDFGYNVGTEFGGRHPAIILKNLKDSLIVIPLSSKEPRTMEYSVRVDKVYGYALMPRWANVTRITQVSLSRIHFEKIGDVKPYVLKQISEKLQVCGIIQ